ncbi:MAG: glycoside hydrolase family 172 protein [bacterium]
MRTKARLLKISLIVNLLAIISLSTSARAAEPLAGNPLKDLYLLREGRSMRASSADPEWESGNADWRMFYPNSKTTLAELEGPGIITHIWMTISNKDRQYPRLMAIRMYWDGEERPSVEAPIGDFFAVGHGVDATVDSLPVQVSSEGRARNCFWPMPFKKSAKIVVANENPYSSGGVIYWYVDWIKLDSLPEDTAYFHAQYRQEYPAKAGRYLVAQIEGRGHYVGTVYSVLANMRGWIGEGDDFFYIDGEPLPSIRGTGTEDYFSDAWGFRHFNHPYHGVTLWEGSKIGARTTAYRWHIADPILFSKSLKFEIEHVGPTFDENGDPALPYGERPDHYSTVAFWYQHGGSPNWTSMPKGPKRLPPHLYIEAEKKYYDSGKKTPDEIKIETGPSWSGGAFVRFTPSEKTKKYEVEFSLKRGGNYELSADILHGPDMGNYIAKLDGKVIQLLSELNQKNLQRKPYYWGVWELEAGKHKMTFEFHGPFEGATDFAIDGLYLRPLGL